MCVLRDGGGGGGHEPKKVCVPKMGLTFLALYSKCHFFPEKFFLVLGGWVVRPRWVGPPDHPPPAPPDRAGGESKEAGARTQSKSAGGQGAARDALDPDVPDTGEGTERERAGAARASPSARGTCDVQRVTQPLPPMGCSPGGPGLALGHSGSNQPTNPPPTPR